MAYPRHMARALLCLLFAISLMTMPFGMTNAAAGAPTHADVTAMADHAAVMEGACADHRQPTKAPVENDRHCAACAALPILGAPSPAAESLPRAPLHSAVATLLITQDPEVRTPPPKAI